MKAEAVRKWLTSLGKYLRSGMLCLSIILILCLGSADLAAFGGGHGGGGHGGGGHAGHFGGGHFGGGHLGHFGGGDHHSGHFGGGHFDGVGHHGVHHGVVDHHDIHHGIDHHEVHHHGHVSFGFSGFYYPYRYYPDYCNPYSPYYDPGYCNRPYYYPYSSYPYKQSSSLYPASSESAVVATPAQDSQFDRGIPDGVVARAPLLSSPDAPEALPDEPGAPPSRETPTTDLL